MEVNKNKKISVKALCLIEHKGKLLLNKGYDKVKDKTFFRIIGGGVNFREETEKALRREFKEELESEIENLQPVGVIENIFTYEGEKSHEIMFIYRGDLSNKKLYKQKLIPNVDSRDFPAQWVPISDILNGKVTLYPVYNYKRLFSELFPDLMG